MTDTNEGGPTGLPVATGAHSPKGFTLNLAGIPIPLRRTFGALDRLLALPIETLGDKIEAKMKANLDSHVDEVKKKRKKRGKSETVSDPSANKAKAIAEWATIAADVDEDESELSAVWRAVLDEIMDDENDGTDLLRIVRELPNADLRYFVRHFGRREDITPINALHKLALGIFRGHPPERLRTVGLIEQRFSLTLLIIFGFAFGTPFFMFQGSLQWDLTDFRDLYGAAAISAVLLLILIYQMHRTSALGRQFARLYRIYSERQES